MKCDICGKFAKIVDQYTDWGDSTMVEPPDEIGMCKKCVDAEYAYYLKAGYMPARWRKADYETKLAKILGYELYTPEGCAWSVWNKIREDK